MTNGDHSIAAGIPAGEGELVPAEVRDFKPLPRRAGCEGEYFNELQGGRRLARVRDQRLAAVYEIGRLMVRHGEALHAVAVPLCAAAGAPVDHPSMTSPRGGLQAILGLPPAAGQLRAPPERCLMLSPFC